MPRKHKHWPGMCVYAEIEPEDILALTETMISLEYLGEILFLNTKFKNKTVFRESKSCVKCGREGTSFRLEHSWHPRGERILGFNLYSVDSDGKHILMTKDHVRPKCKGGNNKLKNLVTMCEPCNMRKGQYWNGESKKEFRAKSELKLLRKRESERVELQLQESV